MAGGAKSYNGRNGWSIGEDKEMESQSLQDAQDAESLYTTLEKEIIPLFYDRDQTDISHEWVAHVKESLEDEYSAILHPAEWSRNMWNGCMSRH